MASTQDDILAILKNINKNLEKKKGKGGGFDDRFDESFSKIKQQHAASKDSKKKAEEARKHAERAKNSGNAAAAKRYEDLEKKRKKQSLNAKGMIAELIAEEVKSISGPIIKTVYTVLNAQLKREGIRIDTAAEMQNRSIEMWGKTMSDITRAQSSMLFDDAMKSAYKALDVTQTMGKNALMKQGQDQLSLAKQTAEISKTNIDVANTIQKNAVGPISQAFSLIGPWGVAAGAALQVISDVADAQLEREKAKIDLELKLTEKVMQTREKMIENLNQSVEHYREMSQRVNEVFMEMSDGAYKFGRQLFLSPDGLRGMSKAYSDINKSLALLNMTDKDYQKMQEGYSSANGGRMSIISKSAAMSTGLLANQLGVSADNVTGITGAMNVFNTSIESGNELIFQMSRNVAKAGLNASKFAKDLQKNLKLAEKYQFKGGVKGMMEMAAWAQKTRFNLDEFAGALEKMHTGNVEDVLTTSAKLNVLGGTAGVLSDPMSMLYNAYMDPTAYAKNINQMISGYGMFNSKTGETDFNMVEMMRMEAMAGALGVSKESFMNQARQSKKEAQIRKMYGNKFGDMTDYVAQNATYDRVNKKWVATVKRENGELVTEDLDKITPDMIADIFPEDDQKKIVDLLTDIHEYTRYLSPKERADSAQKETLGNVVAAGHDKMFDDINKMSEQERQFARLPEVINSYVSAVNISNEAAIKAKTMMQTWVTDIGSLETFKSVVESNLKEAEKFYKDLQGENGWVELIRKNGGDLAAALAEITDRLREEYKLGGKSTKLSSLLGDNTLTKDEMEQMTDEDWDEFLSMYGVAHGIVDKIQKTRMKRGEMVYENGVMYATTNGQRKVMKMENGSNEAYNKAKESERYKTWRDIWHFSDVKERVPNSHYRVNDFIARPNGVIETHPKDTIVGFTNGEAITKNSQNKTDNINLTVNGTLTLSSGNQKVDLMELVRNDPNSLRRLTEQILLEASRNKYGGRNEYNADRYTIG